jgi:hypothetical protein
MPTNPGSVSSSGTPTATAWTRLKVADLLNHPRFLDAAQS